MSPAKLKRALDPIYVGATWAQEFQFFDQHQDQPLDLTGKALTLSLDRKGLPDAHYDLVATVSGNVATVRSERVAFTPGDYAIELRMEDGADLKSIVVGEVRVLKGAGARGEGTEGAQAQPSAVGVVFAETNVVQVINVGLSGTADAVSIPADIGALFGGATTLADLLRYLAENGGGPALRDLAGAVVVSAVAAGTLSVEAASQIVLSGAVSAASSATGSLTVATALTRALVGAVTAQSAAAGALTLTQGGGGALRVVTTRGEVEADLLGTGLTASNNAQAFRLRVFAGAGGIKANTVRLAVPNFAVTAAGTETNAPTYKIGGHVEWGGVAYPFAFGGGLLGDVPAGAAEYVSDILTHPEIAEGVAGWVYIYREYPVGGSHVYVFGQAVNPAIAGESSLNGAAGTVPNRIGVAGAQTASNGYTNIATAINPPFALIGEQITKDRAFVIVGASLEKYQNDTWGDGANGAGGYTRRGLNPAAGKKYAYISLARAAEASTQFLNGNAKRKVWYKYANTGFNGYGGNDFSFNSPVATTINNLATIKADMAAAGIEDFIYSRMSAKTDSTDSWTTVAGQTIRTRAGLTLVAYRDQVDAAVQSQGYRLFNGSPSYEDAANPGVFQQDTPPTTPFYAAVDGTHWPTRVHGLVGAGLQTYVASLPALAA